MTLERILLSEAAKILPRKSSGDPVHINTLRRWVAAGVKSAGGNRVRLKAERVGGRTYTTPKWVADFLRECSDWTEPATETERVGTPADAVALLKAEGFDGPQEKAKVLGLSKRKRNARTVPGVLSSGEVRDQDRASDGSRTRRAKADASEIHHAAERLPVASSACVGNQT